MKLKFLLLAVILGIGFISLSAFKPITENYKPIEKEGLSNPWDNYRSWTKVTKEEPNTGDPTGFVEKKHSGKMGYREIYINSIGAATQAGHAPYKYPEGTMIVKESYKNKAAYEKGSKYIVTVLVKQQAGTSPVTGDWGFVMGAKGKLSTGTSHWAKFCSSCHVYAAGNDYVFMNADFMAKIKSK